MSEDRRENLHTEQKEFETLEKNVLSKSEKCKILEMKEKRILEAECKLSAPQETDNNKQEGAPGPDDVIALENRFLQPLLPDFSVSVLRFQDAIESFSQAVFNDAFDSMLGNIQSTEETTMNKFCDTKKKAQKNEEKPENTKEEKPLVSTTVNTRFSELKDQGSSTKEPGMQEVVEEPIISAVSYKVGEKQDCLPQNLKEDFTDGLGERNDGSKNMNNFCDIKMAEVRTVKNAKNNNEMEEPILVNTTVNTRFSELKGQGSSSLEPGMQEVVEEPIIETVAYKVGMKQESLPARSEELDEENRVKKEPLSIPITEETIQVGNVSFKTESLNDEPSANLEKGEAKTLSQFIPGFRISDNKENINTDSTQTDAEVRKPNLVIHSLEKKIPLDHENEQSKQTVVSNERIQSIPNICITPDTSDIAEDMTDNVFMSEADKTNNNTPQASATSTHDINANPIPLENISQSWVTIPIIRGFSDSEAYTNIAMSIQELSDNEGYEEDNDNSPIIQESDDYKKFKKASVPTSQTVEFEDVSDPQTQVPERSEKDFKPPSKPKNNSSIVHLAFSRENEEKLEANVEELNSNILNQEVHAEIKDTIGSLETSVVLMEEALKYDAFVTGIGFLIV